MTIGTGIAVAAIWGAVAASAVCGGWHVIIVALPAFWATVFIVLGGDGL